MERGFMNLLSRISKSEKKITENGLMTIKELFGDKVIARIGANPKIKLSKMKLGTHWIAAVSEVDKKRREKERA
jgi:hypothetical protein